MDTLTLALCQTGYAREPAEALERLDASAAQARQAGADLLLCPEMSLTGYAIGAQAVQARAEPIDGPLAQAVSALARHHGLALVVGLAERHADGSAPYNTALAVDADGSRLASYRKTHLFGELDRRQFSAGEVGSAAFDWRGWRLGLLICYDVEFPETVRLLALQGVDAVLVPTANMRGYDEVPQLLVPARACENRVVVAYANACGCEGGLRYGGLTTVAGSDGRILLRAGREAGLHTVRLSRAALDEARRHDPLADRRVDLYMPLAGPPDTSVR
ncbi:carbon-nitrogen hydrolase family protein [Leptothrix discophora]|uniref:Carbon-nitrogen hydrolase family protein n=1 Tax=Leptothrix discophora TaxID=89 RepID=A0ABT9FYY0_LEPDI|nr:carbon-nitrogen hydrolase family protein [Leptothrix discophora]MDP4299431.1 carbon-nitrogen hydrolase family protein [Leptothrix discophora]